MALSILQLPIELLARILGYLGYKDLMVCISVCRRLQTILDTSVRLTCTLELGLAGLFTCADTRLTSSQLLSQLRSREHAWSNLSWRKLWKFSMGRTYYMWDLCGSIFVGGVFHGQQPMVTPAGVPIAINAMNVLEVIHLGYPKPKGFLRRLNFDRLYTTFAFDPAQDLLVLVYTVNLNHPELWEIHTYSLTTGKKHPLAREIIKVPVAHKDWTEDPGGRSDAQIMGKIIMFTQRRGPGRSGNISVLEWTTGVLLASIHPVLGDWSCTLLSDTELLVAERISFQKKQPSLEYHVFGRYRHRGISSSCDAASSCCSFQLPFSDKHPTWKTIYCYAPASLTHSSDFPGIRSGVHPFLYPPTPQIIAFRFEDDGSTGPLRKSRKLDMFLLVNHLRKFVKSHGKIVPWDVWGPEGTRFFEEALPKVWKRSIRGYRVVLPATARLLDFNRNMWDEKDQGVVMKPSQVLLDNEGHVKVVSRLPYRELHLPYPFNVIYKNILMGDSVVCVEQDTNEHRIKAFHVPIPSLYVQ